MIEKMKMSTLIDLFYLEMETSMYFLFFAYQITVQCNEKEVLISRCVKYESFYALL